MTASLSGIDWVEMIMGGWKSCKNYRIHAFIEKPTPEKGKKIQNLLSVIFCYILEIRELCHQNKEPLRNFYSAFLTNQL